MNDAGSRGDVTERENSMVGREDLAHPTPQMFEQAAAETLQPWELIDTGRYMPRRIRGSFRGRELG